MRDYLCSGLLEIVPVDTLKARIEWICRDLGLVRGTYKNPSVSGLSRAAGLAPATLGNALKRDGGLSQDVVAKLAAFARVDPGWLMTGEGEPRPRRRTVADGRYPNREQAVEDLLAMGEGAELEIRAAADAVAIALASEDDLPITWWSDAIRSELRRRRIALPRHETRVTDRETADADAAVKARFRAAKKGG